MAITTVRRWIEMGVSPLCLLYTSDAADERSSVDLGGRRIIKKKNKDISRSAHNDIYKNIATNDVNKTNRKKKKKENRR